MNVVITCDACYLLTHPSSFSIELYVTISLSHTNNGFRASSSSTTTTLHHPSSSLFTIFILNYSLQIPLNQTPITRSSLHSLQWLFLSIFFYSHTFSFSTFLTPLTTKTQKNFPSFLSKGHFKIHTFFLHGTILLHTVNGLV